MTDEERTQESPNTEGASAPDAPSAPATPLEQAEARIRELEARAQAAEAEAKNQHGRMLRVAADFENHRKRSTREVEDAKRSGQQAALHKLLPVFDNLERATSHVDAATDAKSMADGLRMVLKQFVEALGKLGIERVDAVGKPFDPMVHESIQFDHHPTIAAGLVAQELQAGYRQGDALMRPALVVVSKGPAPAADAAPASGDSEAPGTGGAGSDEPSPANG